MKIYNVLVNSVYWDDHNSEVFSFDDIFDAQKKLKECYQDALDDYATRDGIIRKVSETNFEIYEHGNFNYDHICGQIVECEMEPKYATYLSYWENEISSEIDFVLESEDYYSKEFVSKLKSLDNDEMNELVTSIADDLLNDDQVWEEITYAKHFYLKKCLSLEKIYSDKGE